MPRRARPDPRPVGRTALLVGVGAVLGMALLWSAWSLRDILVPDRLGVEVDRKVRPGAFEERVPWVEEQAVVALVVLGDAVAAWDSTRTAAGDLELSVRLHDHLPVEEGNRRLTGALTEAGIEILDAFEREVTGDEVAVDLVFGLDGRPHGSFLLTGRLHEPEEERGPKVALILDDLGYQSTELTESFLSLPFPVAVAILPQQVRSEETARRAQELGREVILHLPMEPEGYPSHDPGEGAILVDMSPGTIQGLVRDHLDTVPGAIGISNHMGSMATQDRRTMTAILDVVEERGLFFLDSRTTPRSIVPRIARERRVACVQNDLFLDRKLEADAVLARLEQLVASARRHGNATAIFHPHDVCLEVLSAEVPRLQADGVRFVRLQDLDASRWIGQLPAGMALLAP